MIRFLGNIEAKTDAKGRVFIPAGFPEKQLQAVPPRKGSCCVKMYSKTVWCSIPKASGSPRRTNSGSG